MAYGLLFVVLFFLYCTIELPCRIITCSFWLIKNSRAIVYIPYNHNKLQKLWTCNQVFILFGFVINCRLISSKMESQKIVTTIETYIFNQWILINCSIWNAYSDCWKFNEMLEIYREWYVCVLIIVINNTLK